MRNFVKRIHFLWFLRLMYSFLFLLPLLLSAEEALQNKPLSARDPYRWLEDSADPRTQEWLNTQQKQFDQYVQANPFREKMKSTLKELLNYESYTIPIRCGDLYFFKMRLPGENQFVLYVQRGIEGNPRVLLDPNQFSSASPVALSGFVPSPDGKLLAYGLAESGSDLEVWSILDVSTGEKQQDCLKNIKFFPVAWSPDCQSFYYTRLDSDDFYRIYFHRLGTSQTTDALVYENPNNPELFASPSISDDQNYLLINVMKGSSGPNAILYKALKKPQLSFLTLLHMKEGNYSYLCNEGQLFYCWTNQDAPMGKVIAVDRESGLQSDIIPESTQPLDHAVCVGKYIVAGFTNDVISRMTVFDRKGETIQELPLPGLGTAAFAATSPAATNQESELLFSFTHFVQPPQIYRYRIEKNQLEVFKRPQLTFDPHKYQTSQVFFNSKDGTPIPLFIVHKKGVELHGEHDTLLYGYGGFGLGIHPSYNTLNMAWLESGGIFALANIRGGDEYGMKWHDAGRRGQKQNCFDDFIAAAEWLIGNGYTNPKKLAIRGASNGGLLTSVCLNQRPDLFGAAMVEVGVLDMLRFHLFTVGRYWKVEYGDPEDPADYRVLSRYSPYHNVRKGVPYPPVLVVTGDHDDRVVPLHSYKYTAALQEALEGKGCAMLRVDRQGGHGAGKSIAQWIEEVADTLSFVKYELSKA